ncbi:MAG TPA: hypothetical protein VGQ36_15380 [Thermoanaerobaculia bacterium]|jgi:hypothetical protein|nr:hypothetical protein [Thermoanaerobaculia bacterium]
MQMRVTIGIAIALLLPCFPLLANVSVGVCNQTCICIYWDGPGSSTVEVRCNGDGGWSPSSSPTLPIPGDGSWGGGGTPPNSPAPGMPLETVVAMAVNQANNTAKNKVRGDRRYDPEIKYYYTPNNCTRLFYGSSFSESGYELLNGYIRYRNGEAVSDPNQSTRIPCNEGIAAWTMCCEHGKYVLICNEFMNYGPDDRVATLIHEAMHVAGQRETAGGNNGDQTPPSTSQIMAAVKAACGL